MYYIDGNWNICFEEINMPDKSSFHLIVFMMPICESSLCLCLSFFLSSRVMIAMN